MDSTLGVVLAVAAAAVAGGVAGSVLACVPGLHVYNVLGIVFALVHALVARSVNVSAVLVMPLVTGMMVGYALANTIPSVLLAAPDESALFTVLPGQKYMMLGRGYEAAMMTACGGIAGLLFLVLVVGPLAPRVLPVARSVFRGHAHWILWCVIAFMLMSEWPKGGSVGQAGWRRLLDGWKSPAAGLLTFAMSGLLGFILLYRSPIRVSAAFQNLLPAFVGLFTLPWLLLNILTRVNPPEQRISLPDGLDHEVVARGAFAGVLGGGFAAFFPVVTGGVGGLLAGHATAVRDDRVFLVSQGASKLVYYVGALLLIAVPGAGITRGGGAWMLRGFYVPQTLFDYTAMLASIALAGAVSILLMGPLTRATLYALSRVGYRLLSSLALFVVLWLVLVMTGWLGLLVTTVATGIGLLPVLLGSRRMNCLGVILLPMACSMSGVGPTVAGWLGLL